MPGKDKDFQRRLLATFRVEAEEHIQALSSGLLELERAGDGEVRAKVIESVFREAHSLKGAARAVGLAGIEQVCHSAENLFSALQRGEVRLSQAVLDALHDAVDGLAALLRKADATAGGDSAVAASRLLARLDGVLRAKEARPAEGELQQTAEAPDRPSSTATVRISTERLDALLFQAEELLSAKLGSSQHAADLRAAAAALGGWKKNQTGVGALQRLLQRAWSKDRPIERRLRRLPELLEREDEFFKSFEARLAALTRSGEQMQRALGAMVDSLLDDVKKALMLPASSALTMFHKLVRDLCREQGKEAELRVLGADIEIDRRILDELRDPLMHLLRNCIDHGIERPADRANKGKPARGTIEIALTRRSEATFEIVVLDDGAGIDARAVAEAAVKAGTVSREEVEGRDAGEVRRLVFGSGVSTSAAVTEISGRGLGLAIVREKVERLGGSVAVEAGRESGTTFRLIVPLTLSTFRGVHVNAAGCRFVIPTAYVGRVLRIERNQIKTVENRETIRWNGSALALAHLAQVLGLGVSKPPEQSDKLQVVVVGSPDRKIALAVDEVLEEREVLVKPLGKQLVRVRNIAGASVLGSGELVPILDVPDLLRSAVRAAAVPAAPKESDRRGRKAVLVVEDSITSRTLLKSILEAAGYDVATAVDGAEAFALLKTRRFDAVVSDVDMPRMNGFELTAKIKADSTLSALPVVLVTSLESREDREKGIDAGASAYIVKRSFDQSNLLGALGRLL